MQIRSGFIGRMIALVLVLILLVLPTLAQGGVLTYGDGASGSLNATAPVVLYSFTGEADDLVSIQVMAFTAGLQPTVALNAPTQQQLAFNSGDPFNPGTARINYQLSDSGLYTILVSANGGTGDYAIRLDGTAATPPIDVSGDAGVESGLSEEIQSQLYTVQANPDAATSVTISSSTSGFAFLAAVRNSGGQTIATLTGSDTQPIVANIPQGNDTYTVEVRALEAGSEGNIVVMLGLLGDTTPDATEVPDDTGATATIPPPAATEDVDGACTVANTGSNPINIRIGPGTDYEIAGSLLANTERTVLGVNSPTGWYQIALVNGGTGWVFGNIVTFSGDCSAIAELAAPAPPAATQAPVQATATATTTQQQNQPTATQAQQQQATATYTPSYTPTQQATATYTPSYTPTTQPAPQIAPEDARFNNPLNIALDSTASVLDFVSYPNGDTEDRVRWDITGMNSNSAVSGGRARLVISVSCFGENTDQIQFFTGGNTYGCGDTIVDTEVTFNSKTGSVVITAIGGEGTYVQWVLTGTATRVN